MPFLRSSRARPPSGRAGAARRRAGHRQLGREVAHGARPAPQPLEDQAACPVPEHIHRVFVVTTYVSVRLRGFTVEHCCTRQRSALLSEGAPGRPSPWPRPRPRLPTPGGVQLLEDQVDSDPLRQFVRWRDEAGEELGPSRSRPPRPTARRPWAVGLAEGQPDQRGLTFFSNYESRRAPSSRRTRALRSSSTRPAPGGRFHVEGEVARLDPAESDTYSRPDRPKAA